MPSDRWRSINSTSNTTGPPSLVDGEQVPLNHYEELPALRAHLRKRSGDRDPSSALSPYGLGSRPHAGNLTQSSFGEPMIEGLFALTGALVD